MTIEALPYTPTAEGGVTTIAAMVGDPKVLRPGFLAGSTCT